MTNIWSSFFTRSLEPECRWVDDVGVPVVDEAIPSARHASHEPVARAAGRNDTPGPAMTSPDDEIPAWGRSNCVPRGSAFCHPLRMIISFNHAHSRIFVGPFLMALAACPPNKPGTTDGPENEGTTSDASTSTTTASPASSGPPSTTTGETTAPSEPDTTSTSTSTSTTTLEPDTTTGGDACAVDVTVSLALGFDQCDESLVLIATVHNMGTVDVPAGVAVTFYEGTDASGVKLGAKPTSEPLPASSSTDVVWVVNAPPMGESSEYYVEIDIFGCDEADNSDFATEAACPD